MSYSIWLRIPYGTLWLWPLTLWTFIVYPMWCDQTLYQILVKSNNPRLSYRDLNIWHNDLERALCSWIICTKFELGQHPFLTYNVLLLIWYVTSRGDLDLWSPGLELFVVQKMLLACICEFKKRHCLIHLFAFDGNGHKIIKVTNSAKNYYLLNWKRWQLEMHCNLKPSDVVAVVQGFNYAYKVHNASAWNSTVIPQPLRMHPHAKFQSFCDFICPIRHRPPS